MSRGGFRVGDGRPNGSRDLPLVEGMPTRDSAEMPMDYALRIMRDPNVDPLRRDRMAQVLMPYCHRLIKTSDNKRRRRLKKLSCFTTNSMYNRNPSVTLYRIIVRRLR